MARVRSPNYPQLSLPEAISRVKIIHAAEHHLAAPREVIAKHLGYSALHGAADKVLSAIIKYGLLEDAGKDKLKVSPLALAILYPSNPEEKKAAIREAAGKPALFNEISAEWGGASPSDENLRSYLIRRNFSSSALDRVIQSYRETMELVAAVSGGYSPPSGKPPEGHGAQPATYMPPARPGAPTPPKPPAILIDANVLHVAVSADRLDVTAALLDAEHVDKLIRILEANKALLPEKKSPPAVSEEAEPRH